MRARLLLLVVWLGMAAPATAFAEHHAAHAAFVGGFRTNTSGRLKDDYPFGYLTGVEAGYQPFARIGLQWTLLFGYYKSSSPQAVDDWLLMTDMGFAVTIRVLEEKSSSVCLTPGLNIVRSDAPIPPTDERTFFGPSVGLTSQYAQGDFFFSFSIAYGLLTDGPSGLTFFLAVGVGSR